MRRVLHYLASRSVLAAVVLLVGAAVWLGLGIVNINFAPLAKAGGCGHFCGTSVVDACADPNPFGGSGPVAGNLCGGGAGCPAGQQCYYCCIGCVPPPGAPPGANGCWQPPSDTTPPVTTYTLSGPAGANGWHVGVVQVTLSATDDSSGVAATYLAGTPYTGPRTYSAQGLTTFSYYSVDGAGNTEAIKTALFWIDSVSPSASQSVAGTAGLAGWYVGPVQLTLLASDATSGIWSTTLDGAGYSGPKTYGAQGANPFSYFTRDIAGNASATQSGTFWIDTVAPSISSAIAGTLGASGWYVSPVQVTLSGSDATSGIGTLTLDGSAYSGPRAYSAQGATSYTYSARDVAGNASATQSGSFRIDTTAPAVSVSLSASANADGWHNGDVTVAFTCADSLSGVQSCAAPVAVSSEGAAQNVSGSATDRAGNSASASATLNLDKTAPTISWGVLPPAPDGASGWYVSPVTEDFTCSDALSGVRACPTPITFSSDGAAQSVARTISDYADNPASVTAGPFDIDLTPPSLASGVSPATPDGDSGWYITQPTLTFTCSDATSGVPSCPADVTLADGAGQSVTRTARDGAGHLVGTTAGPFQVDTVAPTPTITLSGTLGSHGWYTSPVQVTVSGSDATSGVSTLTLDGSAYSSPRTYNAEDTTTFTYSAQDAAGNTSAAQSGSLKIDTVPPVTSANLLGLPGANGWYIGPVLVTLSASDATSGVDTILLDGAPYTGPRLYTDGTITVTVQAMDKAGNVEPAHTIAFNADHLPPVTTATITRTVSSDGWYRSDVTIAFSAEDQLSGVAGIVVEGQPYSAPITLSDEGEHRVEFYATDLAGNTEALRTLVFPIDKTPPEVTVNATPLPNGSLQLDVMAHDVLSGVRSGVVAIMRDGKIVRHWNFDGETASVEWDGLDENGQPVSDYTIWASATDRAGVDGTTTVTAPSAPTPTRVSEAMPTPEIPGDSRPTPSPTAVIENTPTATVVMATPSPVVSEATPTVTPRPTHSAPATTPPPAERRLDLRWLGALAAVFALGLAAVVGYSGDRRPPIIRAMVLQAHRMLMKKRK